MPALRRRPPDAIVAPVPWALGTLLREGPAPLAPRPASGDRLEVALVLGPAHATPREAGIPPELLAALENEGVDVGIVTGEEAEDPADRPPAPHAEVSGGGALRISRGDDAPPSDDAPAAAGPLAAADVVLAAGWAAAPAVLTARGVRARAVLVTSEPAPLAALGWTEGVATLGPAWLGGALPPGADAAYVPMPVHRREDLVLVHGEEPFGLLAAAELARRRDDLAFAVSGARPGLELPFPFLDVEPGPPALAHAFASATVALAPPVRGWRPAALAMLACGQVVVAPDDAAGRIALPPETAVLARGPVEAADAVERLLADLTDRAERTRAGLEHVVPRWITTASALAAALRALA
jgi:hypothetical protein